MNNLNGENLTSDCGTCTDFKDWMKQNQDNSNVSKKLNKENDYFKDCPLYRNQLGRASWSFLHTMAAYYPAKPNETEQTRMKDFIDAFAQFFPCKHCATDFQEE